MIHKRQRLPFGFETRYHLTRVHASLNQLECNSPTNRIFLLSKPDLTHSPSSDPLQKVVWADSCSNALSRFAAHIVGASLGAHRLNCLSIGWAAILFSRLAYPFSLAEHF